jgi:hypothetical protein
MARKLKQRELFLIVILIAVMSGFLYKNFNTGEATDIARSGEDGKEDNLIAPVVMLAELDISSVPIGDRNRDLFSYGIRPTRQKEIDARQANIRRAQDEAKRRKEAQPQPKPPVRTPPPVRVASAPKPPFTFIGIVGPKDSKIAVFEEGQTVMIANIGEVIKEPFLLKKVGFESVVIGYTDDRYKDKTTELKMPKDRRR